MHGHNAIAKTKWVKSSGGDTKKCKAKPKWVLKLDPAATQKAKAKREWMVKRRKMNRFRTLRAFAYRTAGEI